MEKWFDVQDEDGVWRIGQCLHQDAEGLRKIAIEGFGPRFHTLYCLHSEKIAPIRSKTQGLTCPDNPLREVLSQREIEGISTRLDLLLMKTNLLELDSKFIRQLIRTDFLVLTHKIFTTPYQIIRQIKMLDLMINKLFINLLTFYLRVIDFSKVFLSLLDTNPIARQLYHSLFELTVIVSLIVGIHSDSTRLFTHKLNRSITSQGFIDFLIKSEGGLFPLKHFFKSASSNISNPTCALDYQISKSILQLFLELCEKAKNDLVVAEPTKTSLILDQAISHSRKQAEESQQIWEQLAASPTLLNKIQALFYSLKPNKTCTLRKFLQREEQSVYIEPIKNQEDVLEPTISHVQFQKMEQRVKKIEQMLVNTNHKNVSSQLQVPIEFKKSNGLKQNLGEEMFLGSVEWALETGDVETARKLIKWRRSLLQVGRITGWQVALMVGCRTFEKGEITAEDIIAANYEYLCKQ